MDILIRDTIKEVATYSFRIRNKDSFNWLDDYYFVSVYPTDETATYFFGQTTTKKTRYGVYEQSHQAFYPSTSCYPPTEKVMTIGMTRLLSSKRTETDLQFSENIINCSI